MSIFSIINENKKDKRTEALSVLLTYENMKFLNHLKDITEFSKAEIINRMINEYRKEYKNKEGEK